MQRAIVVAVVCVIVAAVIVGAIFLLRGGEAGDGQPTKPLPGGPSKTQAAEGNVERWRQAVTERPNDPAAHKELGLALARAGQSEEAIASLRKSLALKGDEPETLTHLGHVLVTVGKVDEAMKLLAEAIRLDPKAAAAYTNMGEAMAAAAPPRLDEAERYFRRAVEILPTYADGQRHLGMFLMRTLGLVRQELRRGRLAEARECFEAAVRADDANAENHFRLGLALAGENRLNEAAESFRRAAELDREHVEAEFRLGAVMRALGRHEQAAEHLRRAVELAPKHVTAQYRLAQTLVLLGQHAQAVRHYRAALEVIFDPRVANDLAWLLATSPEAKVRDGAEAVRLASRAVQAVPEQPPQAQAHRAVMLDTLAAAYAETGDFKKAQETLETAIRLAHDTRQTDLVRLFQQRRALYGSGQPFRSPRGQATTAPGAGDE